jgi:hypothetical protein
MRRAALMGAALLCAPPPLPTQAAAPEEDGALQVELLEGARAQVVDVGSGRARTLPRAALPPGAREGDFVVDGRLDPELAARQAAELRALRARLAVAVPAGLDLAAAHRLGLNSRWER